ncbi:MAG TPA: sugar phosphate isomerase/epimerase family protein [Sphaerochaeta sp.]|nr:sugar phosphate isomerase/epimerase family protein [Sphaerochaeta sp.]HPY11263.1 sugar phosphate isomerase/epimerase family protein [Sphaerochaeta sp.]HQB90086.1 sugar phosphate isomerase/epimerase family protein [Sphaerochaeta sp.]
MNRYAFSTGALYPLPSEQALRLVAEAGFAHAELMPQCFWDTSEEATGSFEKTKVHVSSIHYPLAMFSMLYSAHPVMSEEGRALSRDIVTMGKRLGTEFLVIHPTNQYEGEMATYIEPRIIENVHYLGALCEEASITLAMENYPVGVGQHPQTLERYVEEWQMPVMKVMVDTTEVMEGGEDPLSFIASLSQPPCHLHLSDFKEQKKHLPIGMGEIPWSDLFALLQEKEYTGYYTLEPSYRHYLSDIPTKLRRDFELLSSLV